MPFATPLALLGLAFVPAVVAMYLLRLRRDQAVIPSTLLWHHLVADVEANAPWQRLRRSLLLLLQLLLVVVLAVLAARPFLDHPAGLARDLVIVIDASASMAATDVAPTRLDAAKQAAIDALRDLPSGGSVSVIATGRTARVVATGTTDLGRIRQAIASIQPTATSGDLDDALRLADALAARSGDAEILVATDGALAHDPTARVQAPVRVVTVGRDRRNQAIVALAVRTAPSAVTRSVFVSVANLDLSPAKRRLEVYGDGRLIDAQDAFIDPQARADVVIDDVPRDVSVIEVRLVDDPAQAPSGDRLAADDRAWAIVPPDHLREVLLVSAGDPYLETALTYLPNTSVFEVAPDRYPADAARTDGRQWDLVIFEGALPPVLPPTAVLAIAPTASSPLGDVAGTLTNPGIGALNPDEPVLRYVDLSTTHIAEARKLVLPDWARTVVPGPGGAPLLYLGQRDGREAGVLAFEPRRSDLPLQVAFPILLANLTGELLGGSAGPTDSISAGSPVALAVPAGAAGLHVTAPDGASVDLLPATPDSPSVTYSQTSELGVYTATPIRTATSSPTTPASPSAGSPTAPTASPAGSASSAPSSPPVDPNAPIRFAVNLFDVDESTIAPGDGSTIAALGPQPSAGASGSPGAATTAAAQRPAARDEVWVPLVLAALAFLAIEWAVYQRDALLRLVRAATRRGPTVTRGSG